MNNLPSNILLPLTDITTVRKEKYRKKSFDINLAEGRKKGRNYYDFSYHTNSKPWFIKSKLNIITIVLINRARSDHHSILESLHKIKVVYSPNCNCDNTTPQDLNHVV